MSNSVAEKISAEKFALAAESISFSYGNRPALRDVSFSISGGQITAIVGPNGCGKSTLLRVLIGHLPCRRGQIMLNRKPVGQYSAVAVARQMALVPQQPAVSFGYTVRQMVLMGRWPHHAGGTNVLGFETIEDQSVAHAALEALDALPLAERLFEELSGGERQRVALARALTQQTPAILLDEPTSALDLRHQLHLAAQLKALAKQQNKAIVLVTHDLNLALELADQTLLMRNGAVAAWGPTASVLSPQNVDAVYGVSTQRVEAAGRSWLIFQTRKK